MATYFHGAQENIQSEAAQTLYLMNPTYIDYPATTTSTHQANNMQLFLNSSLSNSSLNSIQQQHHHFVGLPIQPSQYTPQSQDLSVMQSYNNVPINVNQSQLCVRGPSNNNTVSVAQRGLSLSLSSQQVQGDQEMKIVGQSVLMGSKYLKIAQQLLEEVVNVEAMTSKGVNDSKKEVKRSNQELGEGDASCKKSDELSTVERQELQMKKAKLVNMLDKVEQRYRQYHHQMQIIVSSFESVAGFGSAKTYTSLALQTISKQFRCLRDAISNQIRVTSKSLGEEDCFANGGGKSVGSRLRFVDHQLRQQRALQQLGMIQNNAWRPQRGLPERAVSVLRAWLFEHFLHPYPKDSDKHMLAKQTGLTRSQVSNWFINARVRLWKPMVEEMYLEETKDQEQNNEGENKSTKSEEISDSPSQQENTIPSRTEQNDNLNSIQNNQMVQTSQHMQDMYDESSSIMQQRMKKIRSDDSTQMMSMGMKQYDMNNRDLLMKFMGQETGFEQYPIGEISRYDLEQIAPRFGSNGVSLTLGLPHGEPSYITNDGINHLENNNHFIGLNNNGNSPSSSNPNNGYESIDIQNRKQFAAQLLPDYVA